MHCTKCGASVPDDLKFCPRCGTAVVKQAATGDADARQEEPSRLVIHINTYGPKAVKAAPVPVAVQTPGAPAAAPAAEKPKAEKPARGSRKKNNLIALCVMLALVLLIGGAMLYARSNWETFASLFSGPEAEEAAADVTYKEPLVVTDKEASEASHRIYFYGTTGETITLPLTGDTVTVENGIAVYTLPDSLVAGDAAGADTKEVTLDAVRTKTDGTTETFSFTYSITLKKAPIVLLSPTGTAAETALSTATIRFQVIPGSKVTVNGDNISDLGTEDGVFTRRVELTQDSSTVTVEVQTKGYSTSVTEITFTRPASEIELSFDSDVIWSTAEKELAVSGKTEPGAELTCTLPVEDGITVNEDGTFSFTAKLTVYGEQELQVVARKDGKSATIARLVRRTTDMDSYTKAAWTMDYAQLNAGVNNLKGQIYKCVGTVIKCEPSATGYLVTFKVGADQYGDQIILLELQQTEALTVGSTYTAYADVLGVKDQFPFLGARYVYEGER